MVRIILILFSFLCFYPLCSQNLKGVVLDNAGKPVDGAYVYIAETRQGLVCNEQGAFQTTLPTGRYLLQFQCLGYASREKTVEIRPRETTEINVRLQTRETSLKEVVVSQGEDPAYEIMRQAIKKAPYYRSYIKESHFEAYLKGSGKIENIPQMMEKLSGENLSLYKNQLFLQESYSDIKFTAPDRYLQTVKAFSSTIPENLDPKDAIGISTASLYNEMFAGFVSPLHPKAFSYYRFRYEGFAEEGGQVINKIKVTPKLKDPKFLEGYLYIADNDWNIRHAELHAHVTAGEVDYQLAYNPVMEGVYLLTSYSTRMAANVLGIRFNINYETSMKYLDVQLNDSLIAAGSGQIRPLPSPPQKKKSLEIKWRENYTVESDSLATRRDSTYWAGVRNTVLNEEEIRSYQLKDSIAEEHQKVRTKYANRRYHLSDQLLGGQIGGDSTRFYFRQDGLLFGFPEYNFVDGFWMGQGYELGYHLREHYLLTLKPYVYWASARKQLIWNVELAYHYAPMANGIVSLNGGSVSADYSGEQGVAPVINTFYSLLAGKNKAAFYKKNFLQAENEVDLLNGLRLKTGLTLAERIPLMNQTTYSFWGSKNDARPNRPDFHAPLNEQYRKLYQYSVQLTYTPEYYYRIRNGRKYYVRSSYPTFTLRYRQGLDMEETSSVFKQIDLTISQKYTLGLFDRLQFAVSGGMFIGNKDFNYIDYKHFDASNILFTGKDFETSYALLDAYRHSTNDKWAQAFVTYSSEYLLLKRLPFLQGKLFNESLHGHFLYTPERKAYAEFGYSIGLPGLGQIGGFVSFDKAGYDGAGFRISLPLVKEIGVKKR